jgi:predicted Co/Zn/Cd cation transporter (cation efflux family)
MSRCRRTSGSTTWPADAIRREIADALGMRGPQRWLTIDFTADPRWL